MIVCPNCDRENETHYKFCLGCGTELSQDDARATIPPPTDAISAPPMAAPAPTSVPAPDAKPDAVPVATALPIATPALATAVPASTPVSTGLIDAPPMAKPPAQTEPELPPRRDSSAVTRHQTGAPPQIDQPIFDSRAPTHAPLQLSAERSEVDAEADLGTINRGIFVSLPGSEATVIGRDTAYGAVSEPRSCRACSAVVPEGFKFCGVCGSRYEPPAMASPVKPSHQVSLVLIHPDGTEGARVALQAGDTVIGRDSVEPLFADDPFLSPRHATIHVGDGRLTLRDENSLNGVFARITSEVELSHRDMFRVGQQLLRFEDMRNVMPVVQPADDGTVTYGGPNRGTWGRLAAVVAQESVAEIWTLTGDVVHIGRERGEVIFPHDGFVSGAHCTLSTRQGRFYLTDPGSTNGTYMRAKGEYNLMPNDLLLLGQQLFRLDLH
ncbi:MAG: pSer/pThr/pTyr-binding forkhead associated (FHA) protein/RNA polymerase subunit RPABC4 [Bradymonadia bacterium]|jgi:pSer/pThr/pTyr-binding forkhead associated (FHA) protein/RNA polymerase subunit RPABC4/transcription elongation factor Spt4